MSSVQPLAGKLSRESVRRFSPTSEASASTTRVRRPGPHAQARAVLLDIPGFEGWEEAEICRLGGLTNRVFRVVGERSVCLRLPGLGTEEYIDRRNEEIAAWAAAAAGVGPKVLYADPASGILMTEYVGSAVPMNPDAFRTRSGAAFRAGQTLRRLHLSNARFNARFDVFDMMDDYLALLRQKKVRLPKLHREALGESQQLKQALAMHELPIRACHCDPVCENFLDTGEKMLLVDWEYSGMNDPMWDLGDMTVEAGFGIEQEAELLAGYFDGSPSVAERGRMEIYKAMCDLLWSLWSLIQVDNGNPADDFEAYGLNRLNRCRQLMSSEGFAKHVSAVMASG